MSQKDDTRRRAIALAAVLVAALVVVAGIALWQLWKNDGSSPPLKANAPACGWYDLNAYAWDEVDYYTLGEMAVNDILCADGWDDLGTFGIEENIRAWTLEVNYLAEPYRLVFVQPEERCNTLEVDGLVIDAGAQERGLITPDFLMMTANEIMDPYNGEMVDIFGYASAHPTLTSDGASDIAELFAELYDSGAICSV